jgi:hypothetical protein
MVGPFEGDTTFLSRKATPADLNRKPSAETREKPRFKLSIFLQLLHLPHWSYSEMKSASGIRHCVQQNVRLV